MTAHLRQFYTNTVDYKIKILTRSQDTGTDLCITALHVMSFSIDTYIYLN